MKLLPRFVVFLFLVAGEMDAGPIVRETGAIYLSDFGQKPLRLKILRPAPCYFDISMTRYAGTLRFPQVVQVEAFADRGSPGEPQEERGAQESRRRAHRKKRSRHWNDH
jgi:hypothetical protein